MIDNFNKVVDLTYLTAISKGNKAFINEMIGIFLTENPKEICGLENAIKTQDFIEIKEEAHKMKSTIPFVGIDKLIEKDLVEIERLALEKSGLEKIEKLFVNIKNICRKAEEELRTQLPKDS